MAEKLKVQWATPELNMVGNALGYATQNKFMRKYMQRYVDFDDSAEIALTLISADKFKPVPRKINVLFTMWEFMQLPQSYLDAMYFADAIVTPSSFCNQLFRKYTGKPVYTCWEGIEPELYPFYDRQKNYNGGKFRFLWVGAPNPRKGYPFILEAVKVFEKAPNIEIYLKTTAPQLREGADIKHIFNEVMKMDYSEEKLGNIKKMVDEMPNKQLAGNLQVLGEHKNIFMDTRKLSNDELRELYNSAHCFLLPTLGEGWGLTLCEAMATGCPSIATAVTGCADFFNESVGYPIKYSIQEQDLENYGLRADGFMPDTVDFIEQMMHVVTNYPEALRKGKAASERIHNKFTWDRSAQRMRDILTDIYQREVGPHAS